jgi:hypothetical protein
MCLLIARDESQPAETYVSNNLAIELVPQLEAEQKHLYKSQYDYANNK